MLENLRNLLGIFGQAGQIRQKVAELQAELARKRVEGEAGAGAVRVVMSGDFEVRKVELDPTMIRTLCSGAGDETDRHMIEELIASATNDAIAKAQELVRQEVLRLASLRISKQEDQTE